MQAASHIEITEAGFGPFLARCRTKRQAGERLGTTPHRIYNAFRDDAVLVARWDALPSGYFHLRRMEEEPVLPGPGARQSQLDRLVAEAASDCGLDPNRCQRENIVCLLAALFNITGTLGLRRGWARASMLELDRAACPMPGATSLRWYRSHLQDNPFAFGYESLDRQTLEDIALRYGGI